MFNFQSNSSEPMPLWKRVGLGALAYATARGSYELVKYAVVSSVNAVGRKMNEEKEAKKEEPKKEEEAKTA